MSIRRKVVDIIQAKENLRRWSLILECEHVVEMLSAPRPKKSHVICEKCPL